MYIFVSGDHHAPKGTELHFSGKLVAILNKHAHTNIYT